MKYIGKDLILVFAPGSSLRIERIELQSIQKSSERIQLERIQMYPETSEFSLFEVKVDTRYITYHPEILRDFWIEFLKACPPYVQFRFHPLGIPTRMVLQTATNVTHTWLGV